MAIYDIEYRDFVHGTDDEIGQKVKIVKGRKYPIGQEFVVKEFFTDYWGNEWLIAETGEKVNQRNVRLSVPREIKTNRVLYAGNLNVCPHCKAEGTLSYRFDHFDPLSDYIYKRYTCTKCTGDSDTI